MSVQSRSRVLTIMLIDIVSYTKMSTMLGRESFDELNSNFDKIALPVFARYSGWVIKKIGDCFMVAFDSATDSLHCAIEMQNKFWEFNETKPHVPIRIKVAVNTGEVTIRDNDIYGEPVNTVARIEKETNPGQIVFSNATYLAMNKSEIPHVYFGKRRVKGIARPLELFRVKTLHEDEKKAHKEFGRDVWRIIKIIIWVAVLGTAAVFLYRFLDNQGLIAAFVEKSKEFWSWFSGEMGKLFG